MQTPRRQNAWLVRAIAAVVVIGSLLVDQSPLVIVAFLFVVVVPFETLFPRHDQPIRRSFLGLDLGYALGQPFFGVLTLIFGFAAAIVSFA